MVLRLWIVVAFAVLVGCGGKVLDGTCAADDGSAEWSCGDASGIPPAVSQCPPNFVPVGGACGNALVGGGVPNLAADCLDCASNEVGTYWTCTAQGWKSAGMYACHP
jgi:hypothetical protein